MPEKFTTFDIAEYFDDDEAIIDYLNIVLEEDNPRALMKALGDVARARGIGDIAKQTGLERTALYRSLSGDRDARIGTVMRVLDVLGYRMEIKAAG